MSQLAQFVEWLFGLDPVRSGEGVQRTLRHTWPLQPWLTLLLAVGVVLLVSFCYLRERGDAARWIRWLLASLRIFVLACLAFMIAQFIITQQRTGLPYLVVLVDDSASMAIADRYDDAQLTKTIAARVADLKLGEPSRWNLARSILLAGNGQLLRQLDEHYKLRAYLMSETLRPLSGSVAEVLAELRQHKPDGGASRLGDAVRQVLNELRGSTPSAIIVLTDGVVTDGASLNDAASYARRKGVPLLNVALGNQEPASDLELSDLLVDEVVFVDDVLNFEATLTGSRLAGKKVQVRLRQADRPEPLATIDVTIDAQGKPQKIRIPYRPREVGKFEYIVEAEPLAEEVSAENNRQRAVVEVRKEQVRVLLAQAYPNFEYRYLKHMLQRDSTIQLKTVLQEADPEYAEFDQTALRVFPVRREELFEHDVLILGDVDPAFFSVSALENIEQFVTQKGGGVVLIAGPRYMPWAYRNTPLATLLPADLTDEPAALATNRGFQVEPTDLGRSLPTMQLGDTPEETADIWQHLPPLYWMSELHDWKPGARPVAQARTDGQAVPLFVLQHVGAGKVLLHATDETWRWRFRVGDVFFARYWVQTLRYLARAKLLGKDVQVDLSADRRQYRRGDSVRLRARFLDDRQAPAEDDGVVVMIEQPGHPNRRVSLRRNPLYRGVFEGTFSKPTDGKYHAWVTSPALDRSSASTDFMVLAPPVEFERTDADVVELERAAADTKGHFYTIATADRLSDELPHGHEVPFESLPPRELWNHNLILGLLFAMLLSEWILRKLKGML